MAEFRVIALEEHFSHPELLGNLPMKPLGEALLDLGARRLREMDEAGIDLQVISHFPSGPQNLAPADAVRLSLETNNLIAATIDKFPGRFGGFASLPLTAPQEAERELERAVTQLGFKGTLLHGMAAGVPLDDKRFWGLYELAQKLDVPVYIHPDAPPTPVADAYYKGHPALIGPGWSFTVESATQALRLMLSGVFDTYPRLKMILGHMGESLPFSIVRCDANLTRRAGLKRPLRDYFHDNFWITTSANLSTPALICSILEMGVDRILFSVDWPFASNVENRRFIDNAPISEPDRRKILGANAAALLKL